MCLAIPGKIVNISCNDPLARRGTVDFGGVSREIDLIFVPEAGPGDYVLVHAGFALNTIDEVEAGRVLEYLEDIDEISNPRRDGS
jgi:hydrogenase expression/formation protein HypC